MGAAWRWAWRGGSTGGSIARGARLTEVSTSVAWQPAQRRGDGEGGFENVRRGSTEVAPWHWIRERTGPDKLRAMLKPSDLTTCTQTLSNCLIKKGDPTPSDYLQFADEDLAGGDCLRRRINALSNAKRALHLDVELLTDALGFAMSKPRKTNFPCRVEFAASCGVVAPRIVEKVNRLRNLVEHEYVRPERETVEDYVGVAHLFVAACNPLVQSFPCLREFDHGSPKPRVIHTVAGTGLIEVFESTNMELIHLVGGSENQSTQLPQPARRIRADDPEFYSWAKVLLGTR